ncbi:FAD/NAD(P)-binding domain-containing protein [Ganoderma leucocontextum]|nr:FAD/NAD(P)-binding domain-containing protein [Ganoderma leucocontextum]
MTRRKVYLASSSRRHDASSNLSPKSFTCWVTATFNFFYVVMQSLIIWLFKPPPPPPPKPPKHRKPRIAVIGAGMAGVSSAAHAIAHGFDVMVFEQTIELAPLLLYRFHPGVLWSCAFPKRDKILREIHRIWEEYQLGPRTRFTARVTSVKRAWGTGEHLQEGPSSEEARSKWVINDGMDEEFDAVVVAIGTCRAPQRVDIPGLPNANLEKEGADYEESYWDVKGSEEPGEVFEGEVLHSSELRRTPLSKGKAILLIGSGASSVEAVKTGLARGAKHCVIVAPNDEPTVGQQRFSFIWETIIKIFNYRGALELVLARLGRFEDAPRVANDELANLVSEGKCEYVRGDIDRFTRRGIRVRVRNSDEASEEGTEMREYQGDMVYPNLYLQHFSTEDWSVFLTNSGTFDVGIYMRLLLTFVMVPDARPAPKDMKGWVDVVRTFKGGTPGGALSFFGCIEWMVWVILFCIPRIDRLKW